MDEPSLSTQLSLPQARRAAGAGADGAAAGTDGATDACLEVDELVAMVDGALSAERSDAVLAHVDSCPTCADLVGNLGVLTEEPRKLGRYRVERLLGVGGMGMVYRAWDPELQRPVAIKLVRPEHASERSKARMLGEARALARVSHPNVIGVYDVGEHAGEIFLATELIEGETLVTWRHGRSAAALVDAWLQVARGLAAAHAEGVVHRDVKPANVLVGRDGRMRIGDFGIAYQLGGAGGSPAAAASATEKAKQAEGSAAWAREKAGSGSGSDSDSGSGSDSASGADSGSGSDSASDSDSASRSASGRPSAHGTPAKAITVSEVVGTPAYMAPEQHDGKVDARSDQFSVCVALVEALTQRRPVPGEHVDLTAAPGIPASVATALTGVLHRGLRADPSLRFPSMTAFADALAAAMQPPQPRRSRALVASLALGAALLTAAGGLALSRRSSAAACAALEVPTSLWSPARRQQLKGVLPADPDPLVRTWLAEHERMAADVCTATPSDAAIRRRRNACLGELQQRLDQQLTRWELAPPPDALSMFGALAALPRPSRCSLAALQLTADPSPAQAAALTVLREELRELHAPDRAQALAMAAALVERARATGYAPAAIELGRALAAMQASDDRDGARRTLRAALDFGAAQGDDFERVTAMVELISLSDSAADAESLAQRARTRLAALGGDRMLEGTLDYNLGRVLHEKHRSDDALAAFERARHGFRAVEGEGGLHEAVVLISIAGVHYQRGTNNKAGDDALTAAGAIFKAAGVEVPIRAPEVESAALIAQLEELRALAEASGPRTESMFNAEHALASAYLLAEDPDHALEHYRKAAELGEALGLRNDKLVYSLTQSASILMDQKQLDEAEAPMRRALALARQLGIEIELASALVAQGRWLLERGQPAAARAPLAEALELRSRSNEPSRFRGGSRFLLAQALWDAEPKRALELAHAARVDLQDMLESTPPGARGAAYQRKVTQELIEKVDRWLAARSR